MLVLVDNCWCILIQVITVVVKRELVPFIQLLYCVMAICIKNTDKMRKCCLPNSQFEFMKQIGDKHSVKVEPKACEPS
jgi:hypothetical protein